MIRVALEAAAWGMAWLCVAVLVAPIVGAFIAGARRDEPCLMCELERIEADVN
jgi:hypothetical protein